MAIPLKTKLIGALFGLTFAISSWAILFYSDWFVPAKWVSWFAAGISAAFALWVTLNSPSVGLERRPTVKAGVFAMLAIWSWLFCAQTVPSVITRVVGSTQYATAHVSQHYRSTRTCRDRLALREFNPPFGAFCRVSSPGTYLRAGQLVDVTYYETALGRLVLRVEER